jgi:hypothetical protein
VIAVGLVGCGGGSKPLPELTDEQKAKVKAEDKFNDDEEKSGSGKSTRKK